MYTQWLPANRHAFLAVYVMKIIRIILVKARSPTNRDDRYLLMVEAGYVHLAQMVYLHFGELVPVQSPAAWCNTRCFRITIGYVGEPPEPFT